MQYRCNMDATLWPLGHYDIQKETSVDTVAPRARLKPRQLRLRWVRGLLPWWADANAKGLCRFMCGPLLTYGYLMHLNAILCHTNHAKHTCIARYNSDIIQRVLVTCLQKELCLLHHPSVSEPKGRYHKWLMVQLGSKTAQHDDCPRN